MEATVVERRVCCSCAKEFDVFHHRRSQFVVQQNVSALQIAVVILRGALQSACRSAPLVPDLLESDPRAKKGAVTIRWFAKLHRCAISFPPRDRFQQIGYQEAQIGKPIGAARKITTAIVERITFVGNDKLAIDGDENIELFSPQEPDNCVF